jgi:formylglycine-generating enzyme required for sulfatase activity
MYAGDTMMQKFAAHREAPIPDLRSKRPEVSPQLDGVFRRMVAKKPEDRYQTMTEVVSALEGCRAESRSGSTALRDGNSGVTTDWQPSGAAVGTSLPRIPAPTTKGGLSSVTELLAPEKSKHLVLKIVGGAFGTILAPLLVAFLSQYMQRAPADPVPAQAPASAAVPNPVATPAPLVAPFGAKAAQVAQAAWAEHLGTTVEQKNPAGITLVLVPPGEFRMGSTREQIALDRKFAEDNKMNRKGMNWSHIDEETPQHRVTLTSPYWMGTTEVTIGQFRKFVDATDRLTDAKFPKAGNLAATDPTAKELETRNISWRTPGYAVTDASPVTHVTWSEAAQFCNWLSDEEKLDPCYRQEVKGVWILLASGTGYRLPTEAEWEYACRAGTTTLFSFGDDPAMLENYGWFRENSGGSAQAVGLKVANAFGLFDMHGDACEWCHDFFAADYYSSSPSADPLGPSAGSNRVSRGGNWSNYSLHCRSASRHNTAPLTHSNHYGLRVVRVK